MIPRTLKCRECSIEPAPEIFIRNIASWWGSLRVAKHVCPNCGCAEEVVFNYSEILFGHTYAAGTAHFSAEERASVPGLKTWVEGQSLFVEYEGASHVVSAAT
jgi:hypothetical protein